jgi:hypothetical protein
MPRNNSFVNEEEFMFSPTKRGLAAGLVIAAAGFPAAAQARFNLDPPTAVTATAPAAPTGGSSSPSAATSAQSGFQWGDAGIGAAGAVVLVGAAAGASGVARRRGGHHPVAG